jgi:hypothetical protein
MSHAFLSKLLYKRLPQFLSYIFHPLLMPTLGVYVILNSGTYASLLPSDAKNMILVAVLTCTFGLPAAFIPIYIYSKIAASAEMGQRQERHIPLIITALMYYFSFYLLRRMEVPTIIQAFLLASTISVCANLIINTKWKISAHMIGIGGLIGLIISISILYHADIMLYLMISILVGGVIGYARLSLNAHTPSQVYIGLVTGFLLIMFTMSVF